LLTLNSQASYNCDQGDRLNLTGESMKKHFMYSVSTLPLNLGRAFAETIATQSDLFDVPTMERATLNRLLIDSGDLTEFDQKTLESQRLLYNADHLSRQAEPLLRWAEQLIFRGSDRSARQAMKDRLGIVLLEETANCLLELNKRDLQLVTLLLEGRIGAAIRHVPEGGYPADLDEDSWPVERVMSLIAEVLRFWIANDLQMEAAATHVRIYRPTGCDILDQVANGWPVINATIISRIEENLKLYEEVARLYYGEATPPKPVPFAARLKSSAGELTMRLSPIRGSGPLLGSAAAATVLGSGGISRVGTGATAVLRHYERDATKKEVAFVPDDLRQKAERMLGIWRREHGDQLEYMIRFRMDDARWRMKRLRRELGAIKADPKLRRRRAHVQKGLAPLTRLWLACLNAVRWTDWIEMPKVVRGKATDITDVHCNDFVHEAVMAVRRGEELKLPKLRTHHREMARELFFALRCTIVRDPEHLPRALLTVKTKAGQKAKAAVREEAEYLRGRPYSFREIYAHIEQRRKGSTRNSKEVLSHPFVEPANRFLKTHAKMSSPESIRIVEQAAGTAAWRLAQ
jgi:hypothetical protein